MSKAGASIGIIDYGIGNLHSVQAAVRAVGYTPAILKDPQDVMESRHLILPGVGAFHAGMDGLKARGLDVAVKEYALSGKPLLGICLGMQLLMTESEEHGSWPGLEVIPGSVRRLQTAAGYDPKVYRIPHMGWNNLEFREVGVAKAFGMTGNSEVYFVHSFGVYPDDPAHVIAYTEYGGTRFCSISGKGNTIGFQFHPEKSGKAGLKLLRVFCSMATD